MESVNEEIRVVSEDIGDHKVLVVTKGNKTVLLDTMYDENAFFSEWIQEQHIPNSMGLKVILFGLGNGIIARKILDEFSDAVVLAVEPSEEILLHVTKEYSIDDLLENQRFYLCRSRSDENGELSSFFSEHIKYSDTENYCILTYPNYNLLFEEELSCLSETLSSWFSAISADYDFTGDYGGILNKNTFGNLKCFAKSKSFEGLTDGSLKDYTAIIVAAGPSLGKNIANLKAAKGKAIIVAVDAAMLPLSRAGIVPDFVVAVDPCKDGRYLADEKSKHVPLITTLSSSCEMIATHLGEKFFVSDTRIYISRFLRDNEIYIPLLPTGGSVANNALSLVVLLGCTNIILVGQDLAFTGDRTHAENSVRAGDAVSNYKTLCTDTDIFGNEIGTCGEFRLFKTWMENFLISNPDLNVVDATEGGALIKGTKICSLKEAIDEYCNEEVDISSIVAKCKPLLNDELQSKLYLYMRALIETYQSNKSMLCELVDKYNTMKRMIFEGKYRTGLFLKLSNETNEILNHMESDIAMEYVRDVIQDKRNQMIKSINERKNSEEEDLLFVCDQGEQYARYMIEAIDSISEEIREKL